ncbi:MAG: ATP-binding protein [Verrucomicrobia bacterium]|nr:ATP-binding protein [Verrucomicrobiota bacterium]
MNLAFVNREAELKELDAVAAKGGLLALYGRRRVGKTRLLVEWLKRRDGWYSQAIEGPGDMQLQQLFEDIRSRLQTSVVPKTWSELFELLRLQRGRWTLCIDEFPYLVATDRTLPSQLQRWLDHGLPAGCTLILAGSSTRMMHSLFLHRAAPLFGRARKLIQVQPMSYTAFCAACRLKAGDMDSFLKFSLVGGVPKYWEFLEANQTPVGLAEALYFDFAPYMEQEPQRLLRDEGVTGLNALAVLEAIGRGAERTSEIATRLGTAQTGLSRVFQQLLDVSALTRELPFGESMRTTKRSLYRIQDPSLRFWFRVYSPQQSLWRTLATAQKQKLIHEHASTVFEDFCRQRHPGAQRYWEGDVELDLVAPDPDQPKGLIVAEVKWRRLTAAERANVRRQLQGKWSRCQLAKKFAAVRFEVLDAGVLEDAT